MTTGTRHFLFNKEWWTLGRSVKGALLAAGAIAFAIIAIVNASDLYNIRIAEPAQEKMFCKINAKINQPIFDNQKKVNDCMMYALIKVQARQEVTLSCESRKTADSIFKQDSIRLSQLLGSN